MRLVIRAPIGQGFSINLDVDNQFSVRDLMELLSRKNNLPEHDIALVLQGEILKDESYLKDLKVGDSKSLALIPSGLFAAVDEEALIEEYRYLRSQFPLIRMVDLLTYQGKLRCERGYVKELADRGIWPFTEYVKWHEFKMVLSYLHPYKPPTVTWLTDISHPNIIPRKKGKVCVSILGKKWLPNTKLAAVVNALYFLLSDPNPYSAYPTRRCKEVAKIVRMFGFPLKRKINPSAAPRGRYP